MNIHFTINKKMFSADLMAAKDISIPYSPAGPRAWYVDRMIIRPVMTEHFIGSIREGGSVNFREILFNPHGHGTHTETMEHVLDVNVPISTLLEKYFFSALVVTIQPTHPKEEAQFKSKDDFVITLEQLLPYSEALEHHESVVIRTLPNTREKCVQNYSDTNFCYLEEKALAFLAEKNIQHLLVDLPSVDREHDGGKLAAHKAFWQNGAVHRMSCTITEFVFVEDSIEDGSYLLELQIAPFHNDAAPSRPVLYPISPL